MFKSLFGSRNPTSAWPPSSDGSLTFELSEPSLNHVKLGQSIEKLSFLGPDEDARSFKKGVFCYYSRGLLIECEGREHTITAFHIVLRDPEDDRFQSFSGSVRSDGNAIDLSALTPETCVEQLGDYYWLDRDEDEALVFYEFGDWEWQFEFDSASSLKRVIVTAQPVMADLEQRQAYNVTKAWPAT